MVDHRQFLGGPNSPGAVGFVFFAFISLLLFFLLLSSSFFVKWMRADRGFFMIIFLVVGRHNREKNGLVRKKPTKKMKTLTTNLAVLQRASDGVWISFTSSFLLQLSLFSPFALSSTFLAVTKSPEDDAFVWFCYGFFVCSREFWLFHAKLEFFLLEFAPFFSTPRA